MSEPRKLQTFTALDLDRTILKSTTFFEKYAVPAITAYYADLADTSEIAVIMTDIATREQKQRGQAFDFIAVFNDIAQSKALPPLDSEQLAERLLVANPRDDGRFIADIIASGGIELIRALQAEPESAWAFYTTGGQQTQLLKLRVMQEIFDIDEEAPVRWQIITTEHKANDIAHTWYNPETKQFTIPEALAGGPAQAQKVRVIDDKPANIEIDQGVDAEVLIEALLVRRAESADGAGERLADVAQRIRRNSNI